MWPDPVISLLVIIWSHLAAVGWGQQGEKWIAVKYSNGSGAITVRGCSMHTICVSIAMSLSEVPGVGVKVYSSQILSIC